jgi:hypothetical protein
LFGHVASVNGFLSVCLCRSTKLLKKLLISSDKDKVKAGANVTVEDIQLVASSRRMQRAS